MVDYGRYAELDDVDDKSDPDWNEQFSSSSSDESGINEPATRRRKIFRSKNRRPVNRLKTCKPENRTRRVTARPKIRRSVNDDSPLLDITSKCEDVRRPMPVKFVSGRIYMAHDAENREVRREFARLRANWFYESSRGIQVLQSATLYAKGW